MVKIGASCALLWMLCGGYAPRTRRRGTCPGALVRQLFLRIQKISPYWMVGGYCTGSAPVSCKQTALSLRVLRAVFSLPPLFRNIAVISKVLDETCLPPKRLHAREYPDEGVSLTVSARLRVAFNACKMCGMSYVL